MRDAWRVEIDGKVFRFWDSLLFSRAINEIDRFTVTAPFDPENADHRELFRPAKYREASLYFRDEKLFTGTLLNPLPKSDASGTWVEISAYAKCGVWEDFELPPSAWPSEFNGLDLQKIANQLGAPFGLTPSFAAAAGATFEKAKLEANAKIWPFVVELAKQRNLCITSDPDGNPQFWQSITDLSSPVAVFEPGSQPLTSVDVGSLNDRLLPSAVTGIAKTKSGKRGTEHTLANTLAAGGPARHRVITLDDTDPADVPTAVRAHLGRAYGEAIEYTLGVATIFDQSEQFLWDRNTSIKLRYPKAMIYRQTDFLIRAVDLAVSADAEAATLRLALPGAFSGEIPSALPWDESA